MDGLTSLLGKSVAPFVDISTRVWQKVVSQVLLVALKGQNMQQNYKSIVWKLLWYNRLGIVQWISTERIQTLVNTHISTLLPLPKSLNMPERMASATNSTPSSLYRRTKWDVRNQHKEVNICSCYTYGENIWTYR